MCANQVAPSSPTPAPMGRKRTVNFDLPPRMAKKGDCYYYVCNEPRKWLPLGKDRARANRQWAVYEDSGDKGLTVGEVIQRYLDRVERAENTERQYRMYHKALAHDLAIPAKQMTSQHLAVWREIPKQRQRPNWTNGCLAVAMAAFRLGHEQGLCPALRVGLLPIVERDTLLTDAEFLAIRRHAEPWLVLAMDIGYLTAARPVDIRNLRWEMVGDRLGMRQIKTQHRMAFTMTPVLQSVIDTARQRRILGLYVVANEKGKRISEDVFGRAWRAAREVAGIPAAQFRDIRAKSGTDAESAGQDYQALLGHASKRMSERYLRGRRTTVAEPLRKKL